MAMEAINQRHVYEVATVEATPHVFVGPHEAMGTLMSHQVFGENAAACLQALRAEITRLEACLSRFLPASDISRVNRAAGLRSEPVGRDTFELLSKAAEYGRAYPGCFDITIGPLVDLWRAARETADVPGEHSLRQALVLVNSGDLLLDPWQRSAGLRYAGQSIDLGGIGKGYAGDRLLRVYRAYGIRSACSNLGGNVVTLGSRPDGSPWRVGIQHPRQPGRLVGALAVCGQSVVTSGDYQRCYFDRQGQRRHHILNPVSGWPVQAGWISVSVVAEQSLVADALSTILFAAGPGRARAWLRQLAGVEAVLVDEDLRVWVTPGLAGRFTAAEGVQVMYFETDKESDK